MTDLKKLAEEIEHETLPREVWGKPLLRRWFIEGISFATDIIRRKVSTERPRPERADDDVFTDIVISTLEEVSDDALEEIAVYVDEWAEKNGISTPGLSAHKCNDEYETFHSIKEERDLLLQTVSTWPELNVLVKENKRLQALLDVRLPSDVKEMAKIAVEFNAKLREAYIRLATHAIEHVNNGLCPEGPEDPARDPDCQVCRLVTLFVREGE